ncbi:hypothetical protein DM860_010119 [Cuscuta australis]|uniref:Uncharacterized protein n=1 Tax=Cuscuta australis TaxID=267555 RepID=A0A328D6H3_9ASTE|nr:hypothetical protein DM860_010119 [Cuscuta australis]
MGDGEPNGKLTCHTGRKGCGNATRRRAKKGNTALLCRNEKGMIPFRPEQASQGGKLRRIFEELQFGPEQLELVGAMDGGEAMGEQVDGAKTSIRCGGGNNPELKNPHFDAAASLDPFIFETYLAPISATTRVQLHLRSVAPPRLRSLGTRQWRRRTATVCQRS